MRLETRWAPECAVVSLHGALTMADVPALRRQLSKAVAEAHDCVVCDLSPLDSADPLAMAVFARRHVQDGGPGPLICLAGARGSVAEVVDRLGLRHFMPVAATVADAAALARERPPRLCAARSLTGGFTAPRQARRFAVEVCEQWQLGDLTDSVEIVVSELATNAVRHARSGLAVRLERTPDRLFVSVKDEMDGPVGPWWRSHTHPGLLTESGKGLAIVRALATRAGAFAHPAGGTVVWAAFKLPPPRPTHRVRPMRPVRTRITVQLAPAARPGARPSWAARLGLTWHPERPEIVTVSLESRPPQSHLPRIDWELPRSMLVDSLVRPVRRGRWLIWPEGTDRQLVLEVPARPRRTLRVPAWRVRRFLDSTGPCAPTSSREGGGRERLVT